jgi:eukaryotic-like serine/threonine-protein kinase
MALLPGTKLGPYEIISAIGAGGMGEVYRAKDTRIDRIVAIKTLPAHLADTADLKQRFEREAKAISSLNHPNICALYDIGHQDGVDFLVMEYLEGDPLSTVLDKGPMPTPQLLQVALQITDALDKAHKQGLVHRDLKPGNIVLTKNGAKLLDFGLAKWQAAPVTGALNSITRTSSPLTGEGAIVGTFQYMSPEQLEGKEADIRSDLFSFGVVLYEMATGKRPFEGRSQASLIASILKEEPRPISAIQPMTPPALERLVKQCLAKDPDDRWQSAGDLKREITWIVQGGSQIGVPAVVASKRKRRLQVSWIVAAVGILAALGLAGKVVMTKPPVAQASRFTIPVPPEIRTMRWPRISPDGRTIAFQSLDTAGRDQLWVRPLNSLTPYPLIGTEGAGRPFWSPDSRYLAFISAGQLKKISVGGGPVQLVSEATGGFDGSWGAKNVILYDGGSQDSIRGVSVTGGTVTGYTSLSKTGRDQYHCWPTFLPDGNHFLFLASTDSGLTVGSQSFVAKVGSLDSKDTKALFVTDSRIEYDPAGYVLYVLNNTLMARPFDVNKLQATGEPAPVAEHVLSANGNANFSVSNDGSLIYLSSGSSANSELVWLDRTGKEIGKTGDPAPYRDIALSPDGKRLAYSCIDPTANTEDIWVRDLARNVSSRLTFDPKEDIWPVWSPDGTRITFASKRTGPFLPMTKLANGVGSDEQLFQGEPGVYYGPTCWSRDGKSIGIARLSQGQWDVGIYDVTSRTTKWLVTTQFNEQHPEISPDGRFLAYQSAESGRWQVYVLELGGSGGKWQISQSAGTMPTWRADGKELFFVSRGTYYVVPVNTAGSFESGTPVRLFDVRGESTGFLMRRYDVSSDGQRFLVNRSLGASSQNGFVLEQNWSAELVKPH